MVTRLPRLHMTTESRLPIRGRDYDPDPHRYTEKYLKPRGYRVTVNAFPVKELFDVIEPEDVGPPTGGPRLPIREPGTPPRRTGGPLKPIRIERLLVPPNTVAFDFSIRGSAIISRRAGPNRSAPP
jgi:hypothetical protein